METIHIAYSLDDDYTEITCVSTASMLYNTKNMVHFHVVESRLSDSNKSVLTSLKNRFPHGIWSFHAIDELDEQVFNIGTGYFSHETYYRLFLPEMFLSLDKMIYIDGDTVVDGDIAELWNIELGDRLLGAVPNLTAYGTRKKRWLGMSEESHYFNAGILLLNLNRLREFELTKKAAPIISDLYEKFRANEIGWSADQEVLNHLLHREYKVLPVKFNLCFICYSQLGIDGTTLESWREALNKPCIIHYIGKVKPNKISKAPMQHPLWERYYEYKAMTPFADTRLDDLRIKKYHELEANMDKALLTNHINFLEYKRHTLFDELASNLSQMRGRKKLALWGAGIDIGYIMAILSAKDIYADVVVDGLEGNCGKNIFHYTIQSPTILHLNYSRNLT